MTDTAKLKAAADVLMTATEISNQLRHLADNEIDSDSFAVVTENYNGREVEFERPITDLATDAARVIDELIAALESAEKRGADMEVACELFAESKLAQIKLEAALGIAQQRLAELEARNLEVIITPRRCHDYASVAVQQRDEQWYKALHDACDRAGINLETGGEA
ncbi:TPA: hypothetical protein JD178_08300 [Cronobacter sakazakii]|nr:hypothetical protein [Cronobacter sakazakii]